MAERSPQEQFDAALRALDLIIERTEAFHLPSVGDFIIDLGVIGLTVNQYGKYLQVAPYKSSRQQLVERWKLAGDDATRRQIVRDAQDLARSAAHDLRGGQGNTSVADEVRHEWSDLADAAKKAIGPSEQTITFLKVAGLAIAGAAVAAVIVSASSSRRDDR